MVRLQAVPNEVKVVPVPVVRPTALAPDTAPEIKAAVPPPAIAPRPPRSRRKLILLGVLAIALAGAATFGVRWWTEGRFLVSTDDAYIHADLTSLSAKVTGYVVAMPVSENQPVHAGDVIARIDPGDYQLALTAAQQAVDAQGATIERLEAQALAQQAAIDQAQAALDAAKVEQTRAQADYERYDRLASRSAGSRQQAEDALAARDKAVAAVAQAEAALAAARGQLDVLAAQKKEAEAALPGLQTKVAMAQRDLDDTEIRAPIDGVFGNKAVDLGALVQPGTRIGSVVPASALYIEANFKETQLAELKPGQHVTIEVDAASGAEVSGTVESFAPASGSVFSLLPPENATGNFTKIVQRVPVRIALDDGADLAAVLRPGLSAVVTVDIRTGPGA
jgi:membrane fusion protein (multidrug efflux system)